MYADETDKAVCAWVLDMHQDDGQNEHLKRCPTRRVAEAGARDGTYGCDTGCEYVRLEATITCDDGETEDFTYGDFGDLAWLLEDFLKFRDGS